MSNRYYDEPEKSAKMAAAKRSVPPPNVFPDEILRIATSLNIDTKSYPSVKKTLPFVPLPKQTLVVLFAKDEAKRRILIHLCYLALSRDFVRFEDMLSYYFSILENYMPGVCEEVIQSHLLEHSYEVVVTVINPLKKKDTDKHFPNFGITLNYTKAYMATWQEMSIGLGLALFFCLKMKQRPFYYSDYVLECLHAFAKVANEGKEGIWTIDLRPGFSNIMNIYQFISTKFQLRKEIFLKVVEFSQNGSRYVPVMNKCLEFIKWYEMEWVYLIHTFIIQRNPSLMKWAGMKRYLPALKAMFDFLKNRKEDEPIPYLTFLIDPSVMRPVVDKELGAVAAVAAAIGKRKDPNLDVGDNIPDSPYIKNFVANALKEIDGV